MPPAIRLTFSYSSDRPIELVESRQLSKRVAGTHVAPMWVSGRSGFLLEVRNGLNEPIYQRVMDDPILRHEGPAGKEGELARVEAPRSGIFSVVVPDLPDAARVVIYASRPADEPSKAIADFDVRRA